MLKMRPQYAAAELAHIGDNKRRPELRPRDEFRRFRVVDHPILKEQEEEQKHKGQPCIHTFEKE